MFIAYIFIKNRILTFPFQLVKLLSYTRKILSSISLPVIRPPRGVLTPDPLFTAVRENDPASGKERTNELMMLEKPNANNSCEASTALPLATTTTKKDRS
jgi:hypothetical protein